MSKGAEAAALRAAMASRQASEASFFNPSSVRDRMIEKKKGALRTAKMNASLVSKIKTKIINNSSTIKVSLKHNNKALALALNAEKTNAQRLAQEKVTLQMEVKRCHFQNAVLRHKLSFLNNILKEFENLMDAVKMAQLSEFHTSFESLSNGQHSSITEDSWVDDIVDGQFVRATGMPMRVPISKLCNVGQQGGSAIAVQTFSLDLQRPASNKPMEIVPVASKDTLPPQSAEKPQSHQEENGKKPSETTEVQEAFLDSCMFGAEALCASKENPNSLAPLAWEYHPLSDEGNEMAKEFLDRLSQGHVTQRRKRSTLSATSTVSSSVDIFPSVISTQAARCSITKDSSSSSKSNTEPELKCLSSLVSPTQPTVTPDRQSLGKEIFCDQPQAKETGCGVEVGTSNSQDPEFVPLKVKIKGNSKPHQKTAVKKASKGKKKTDAIKSSAESSPDLLQAEESAQNAKKLLHTEAATHSNESEVSEMRQKACVGALNGKGRGCGVEQHSCSPDGVQDLRRTYTADPAQLHSLRSDLLQQVKKEAVLEIQSMESLSGSQVPIFSGHEAPSDYSRLQNSPCLRKEISSTCVLQEDSSVSTESIRCNTNRKTRIIKQGDDSPENLPSSLKIPEAKAEEQPKRRQRSRKSVRKNGWSDQRNDVFQPCIDVQGAPKETTKDLPDKRKCSRKTYIVHSLDLSENSDCVQRHCERGEIVPSKPVPGSKASKIPRVRRMVAAQSNKNQPGDLQEKGRAEADDNNVNALKNAACSKLKPQRNTSSPPETDTLASQSDGAKVLIGSSAELASKQTDPMKKFSCITDLLSDPDALLEEQIAEPSLTNNLTNLSQSLEPSSVTCSAALPVSSRLTDVPVLKSLSTEGNKMPDKSSVGLESSLVCKEKTAEERRGGRNQAESSSRSSPSQDPEIRPLQDLTNARTRSSSSSGEGSGRLSRRRRVPTCYAEPKLNRKLRQGDPFTDMDSFHSPVRRTTKKKTPKAKEMTRKIKVENEWLPEGCPSAEASELATMARDREPEVK